MLANKILLLVVMFILPACCVHAQCTPSPCGPMGGGPVFGARQTPTTVTLPINQSLTFSVYNPQADPRMDTGNGFVIDQLNHNADGSWSLADGDGNPCSGCGTLSQQTTTSVLYTPPGASGNTPPLAPTITGVVVVFLEKFISLWGGA